MPVEVIKGFPCISCGGVDIEVRKERTYYWVEFGILSVERELITTVHCAKRLLSVL